MMQKYIAIVLVVLPLIYGMSLPKNYPVGNESPALELLPESTLNEIRVKFREDLKEIIKETIGMIKPELSELRLALEGCEIEVLATKQECSTCMENTCPNNQDIRRLMENWNEGDDDKRVFVSGMLAGVAANVLAPHISTALSWLGKRSTNWEPTQWADKPRYNGAEDKRVFLTSLLLGTAAGTAANVIAPHISSWLGKRSTNWEPTQWADKPRYNGAEDKRVFLTSLLLGTAAGTAANVIAPHISNWLGKRSTNWEPTQWADKPRYNGAEDKRVFLTSLLLGTAASTAANVLAPHISSLFGRRKRSTDDMPMIDTEETRARLLEYIKTLDTETRDCLVECKPCAPFIGDKPVIMAEVCGNDIMTKLMTIERGLTKLNELYTYNEESSTPLLVKVELYRPSENSEVMIPVITANFPHGERTYQSDVPFNPENPDTVAEWAIEYFDYVSRDDEQKTPSRMPMKPT